MELDIQPRDVVQRVPHLATVDEEQLATWIEDAISEIQIAFARRGRDFNQELETSSWLAPVARRVVRDMVAAVALVGSNVGMRSASSTTGPQADSVTYSDVDSVSWGGVRLTPAQLVDLGLGAVLPRGKFAPRIQWPELPRWGGDGRDPSRPGR